MTPPGMVLNLAVVVSSAAHFNLMFSAVLGFALYFSFSLFKFRYWSVFETKLKRFGRNNPLQVFWGFSVFGLSMH